MSAVSAPAKGSLKRLRAAAPGMFGDGAKRKMGRG